MDLAHSRASQIEIIPLASTEFRQTGLPDLAQANLDFETLGNILTFGRFEFGKVAGQ